MSIIQPQLSSVATERVADRAPRAAMAQCPMCGAALDDVSQRFCGGDRCDRVWMRHAVDDLRGQGRMTWLEAERGWVATPEEIVRGEG